MAAALLERAALSKGKQVRVESQQHSADSWASYYRDESPALPSPGQVPETMHDITSAVNITVVDPPVTGNIHQDLHLILLFRKISNFLRLFTEPAAISTSVAPDSVAASVQESPAVLPKGNDSNSRNPLLLFSSTRDDSVVS